MTFSIAGRCAHSGMLGVAITTSSISVGARCPHARAGVGAVASQNVTDPSLGVKVLDQLGGGFDAEHALQLAMKDQRHLHHRQITVIDKHGNTACHQGNLMLGAHAFHQSTDCIAAGNLLADEKVIFAMTECFSQNINANENKNKHLAERLLDALDAGLAAGGEAGELHSAALLVVDAQTYPLVDLRIDWREHAPLSALRELWRAYQPQMQDYVTRAIAPNSAPSYGVPGDL